MIIFERLLIALLIVGALYFIFFSRAFNKYVDKLFNRPKLDNVDNLASDAERIADEAKFNAELVKQKQRDLAKQQAELDKLKKTKN